MRCEPDDIELMTPPDWRIVAIVLPGDPRPVLEADAAPAEELGRSAAASFDEAGFEGVVDLANASAPQEDS